MHSVLCAAAADYAAAAATAHEESDGVRLTK